MGVTIKDHQLSVAAGETGVIRRLARAAGILFLILLFLGPLSILFIPSQLFVDGDPTATAANIADSEGLFRLAIISDTVILLTEVVMASVLFALFVAVSRPLAMVTALARLCQAAVMGTNLMLYFALLVVVGGGASYFAIEQAQRDSLVMLLVETHEYGVLVGQAFFALSLVALGLLIRRAWFAPRILGTLMVVAGAGYLIDSLGVFLSEDLEQPLSVVVMVAALIGELPFFLWLLVRSFDNRWPVGLPEREAAR